MSRHETPFSSQGMPVEPNQRTMIPARGNSARQLARLQPTATMALIHAADSRQISRLHAVNAGTKGTAPRMSVKA